MCVCVNIRVFVCACLSTIVMNSLSCDPNFLLFLWLQRISFMSLVNKMIIISGLWQGQNILLLCSPYTLQLLSQYPLYRCIIVAHELISEKKNTFWILFRTPKTYSKILTPW